MPAVRAFNFRWTAARRKIKRDYMEGRNTQKSGLIHKMIVALLTVAALISGLGFFRGYMESHISQKEYEKLARMVDLEETAAETRKSRETIQTATGGAAAKEPYRSPIDFEKLSEINPDVVGWIRIPDTNIDYPIVQSHDNDAYLHTSFEGEESSAGSIFLDFESQKNLRGYNTIIYGHNMKNGFMFRDINLYKDETFFKEHQYFEIYTPRETIHLKAVSCYYIENTPEVRRTRFRSREAFEEFVQKMLEPCEYGEIPEGTITGLYTLVTCSYEVDDGRTILFAVETDENTWKTE